MEVRAPSNFDVFDTIFFEKIRQGTKARGVSN